MPNRILKESILDSPTLARLDDFYQDQFPRLLLLVDDWGCFNADPEAIKGRAYPKRKKVTPKLIEKILRAFYDAGMLFMWLEGDRTYGYWIGWDNHNYCNGSQVDDSGKQVKHRRKTPEPPLELLDQYVTTHKDKLGQAGAKCSIPIPNPIPIPIPLRDSSLKKPHGEFGHALLTDTEYENLTVALEGHRDAFIRDFDRWVHQAPEAKHNGVRRKDRDPYASMLNWYDKAKKEGKVRPIPKPAGPHTTHRCEFCEDPHVWQCTIDGCDLSEIAACQKFIQGRRNGAAKEARA